MAQRGQEGEQRFRYEFYRDKVYRYKTDHARRGICLIINNIKFDKCLRVEERTGSERDCRTLNDTFKRLGFEVRIKINLGSRRMIEEMESAAQDPHNRYSDCFVFILMTHGRSDGYVYGTDSIVLFEDMMDMFNPGNCPEVLVGKPKLFFIQACRGSLSDGGAQFWDTEVPDAMAEQRPSSVIPAECDKLFVFSSAPDYEALRHTTHGSWFIQVLCAVLDEHAIDTRTSPPTEGRELMWMMQRVCHIIAHEFGTSTNRPRKQMPQIVGNLSNEFYFTPKRQQQETTDLHGTPYSSVEQYESTY